MPPPLLFSLDGVDLDHVELDREAIYRILPQRREFMVLDGICMVNADRMQMVAFAEIRADAWWVEGHLPSRPLLPGVLMLEMAGQACAVATNVIAGYSGFTGFGGVDDCKFRGSVVPPARLYVLCECGDYRRRRVVCNAQGICNGKQVFEATVTGVAMSAE